MAEPLDELEIKISSSSTDAVKKVNNLVDALDRLKKAASLEGVENTAEKIKAIGKGGMKLSVEVEKSSFTALDRVLEKVNAIKSAIEQVNNTSIKVSTSKKGTGKKSDDTQLDRDQGKDVPSTSVDKVAQRVGVLQRAFAYVKSTVTAFKTETLLATKEGTAALNNMKKELFTHATIWGKIKDTASGALDKIKTTLAAGAVNSKAISSALKVFVPVFGTLGTGFKKLGSGLKSIGKGILNYITNPFKQALGVVNKWKAALTRVAFYRLVRTAIKMVTQGFQEGINNLYYFSSLVGTQFAPTMDALASSSLYLKNSLGAMAAPLIQAVAPAVTYLIDLFVSLLNVVNMLFSVLSGRTYTKAMKTSAKYADDLDKSLGGGAASAKELQRYLIGIDQLTIMPDEPNKGGGGGGGSDLGAQYEEMFEEVPLPDWVLNIKDAINQGDWTGAGELLAEKINSVIAGVDFDELGRKLGGGIQNAISFALGFVRETNWQAIGVDFAEFLNGLFDSINPEDLGALIASKINIAFELAYGFVTEFEWDEFGTWLGGVVTGWVNEIDVDTVANAISGALKGAFNLVATFFTTADFEEIGTKVGELLATLDWGEIFSSALSAGGAFLTGLSDAISGIVSGLGIDLDLSVNDAKVTDGGTINKDGLLTGIAGVLTAVAAGSILFKKSGLAKTALIATAAVGFTGNLVNSLFNKDGSFSSEEMVGSLVDGLNIAAGALLGFKVGGVKGAVIGAIISTGIMGKVNSMIFDKDGKLSTKEFQNSMEYLFSTLGLAVTGWIFGGPMGAVVGLSLGVLLEFAVLSSSWKKRQGDYLGPAGNMSASELSLATKDFDEWKANNPGAELPVSEYKTLIEQGRAETVTIDFDATATKNFENYTNAYNEIKLYRRSQLDLSARNRTPRVFDEAKSNWKEINSKSVTLSASARKVNESVISSLSTKWKSLTDKSATITGMGVQASSLADLKNSYNGLKDKSATVTAKGIQDKSIDAIKSAINSISGKTVEAIINGTQSQSFKVAKTAYNNVKDKTVTITYKANGKPGVNNTVNQFNAGGGIFAGGRWHPVQGYASGGSPRRGRLFWANENGMPELVGSIGGNTAVMNNGQIVASVASGVYRAVSAAMGGVGNYFANIATGMSRIPEVLNNIVPVHPQPILVGADGPAFAQMDTRRVGSISRDGMGRDDEDKADIINAIYAMGQRIITAINENGGDFYLDGQKVGAKTTEVQNRQDRMYGKPMGLS